MSIHSESYFPTDHPIKLSTKSEDDVIQNQTSDEIDFSKARKFPQIAASFAGKNDKSCSYTNM